MSAGPFQLVSNAVPNLVIAHADEVAIAEKLVAILNIGASDAA